jgi:predicted enzyme related to lactoylglutathione lyase
MPHLAHFAINADDLPRARRFYENVFGWAFSPYGPPGFFQIDMGKAPVQPVLGALQQRRELAPGVKLRGFECTISVSDVHATARLIEENGGKVVMAAVTLPNVGQLLFFEDPEGNLAGAMQYDKRAG